MHADAKKPRVVLSLIPGRVEIIGGRLGERGVLSVGSFLLTINSDIKFKIMRCL